MSQTVSDGIRVRVWVVKLHVIDEDLVANTSNPIGEVQPLKAPAINAAKTEMPPINQERKCPTSEDRAEVSVDSAI
jgi:hypothetical protein